MVDIIEHRLKPYKLNRYSMQHQFIHNINMIWATPSYMSLNECHKVKIYISGTIVNAVEILHIVVPWLIKHKMQFKVIASMSLLKMLNDNAFGYIHSGKFITIYVQNYSQALLTMESLHQLLKDLRSIPIPCAKRYCSNSLLFWDEQHSPIQNIHLQPPGLFLQKYILIETIRQRARGGTFLALEVESGKFLRKVIIKEARNYSEIEEGGLDAVARLQWQFTMLKKLNKLNLSPKPYKILLKHDSTFLVMEHLKGRALRELILYENKLNLLVIKDIIDNVALQIEKLHSIDVYFLELCPDNVMILEDYSVKLIDCDLCNVKGHPPFANWDSGTPGFFPDYITLNNLSINQHEWYKIRDIYALGATLFAMYFPKWYQDIFTGVSHEAIRKNIMPLANTLSCDIKLIISRALLLDKPFVSVKEFRLSLKNLAT